MKRLTRSNLLLWAFFLTATYLITSTLIPRIAFMTILNGIFLGIVVAVIIIYTPLVWLAFKKGKLDRVSQLSLGIGFLWLSIAGQRLYWLVWHANGMPDEWRSNPFLSAMAFCSIIGGALFVSAPGHLPEGSLEQDEFWGANRNLLIFLGALGGLTAFAIAIITDGHF